VTVTQRNSTRHGPHSDARAGTGTRKGGRTDSAPSVRAPRWAVFGSLLTATAGLGVSIYLTVVHYTATVTLACPQTTTVNCEKVTSSPESMFLGLPVAVLGVGYFLAMLLLCSPAAWRVTGPGPLRALRWLRPLAALGGVGFVAWLVYAELFVINAICLWCTAVHVLAFVLFGIVALGTAAAVETARAKG
jgi:uncharacterized membrane protein